MNTLKPNKFDFKNNRWLVDNNTFVCKHEYFYVSYTTGFFFIALLVMK